ncbi:hypothetical protein PV05_07700 [Exophiala xenobiotica]|uniref:Uncharacterized protein n=1 Tax=Exophiala xenobiotica TaxID=348802 RepID=A0A0D2CZ61_9EURO|nr:uncharacterized protein PV05_07700 [Exophiala xenobiotica]KIW55417.1 hypothetical protein PV05_07700 [Exophiala xenobiotica]
MAKAAKVSLDDVKHAAEVGYVDSFKVIRDKNKDNGDDASEDDESIELSSSDEEDRDSGEEDEDIELSSSDEEDDTDDTDNSEDGVCVTIKTKRVLVTRSKKTLAATNDINKRRKVTGNHRGSRTKGRVFKAGKLSKSK